MSKEARDELRRLVVRHEELPAGMSYEEYHRMLVQPFETMWDRPAEPYDNPPRPDPAEIYWGA